MNETMHASDAAQGAHPAGEPAASTAGDGAHQDAAHADHGHGAPLGPVDWYAWAAGLLGIAAGLVVAACLYLSTSL